MGIVVRLEESTFVTFTIVPIRYPIKTILMRNRPQYLSGSNFALLPEFNRQRRFVRFLHSSGAFQS